MKKITLNDIRAFSPCYDPAKYLPENWEGTALDILKVDDCPAKDRLWVVLRIEFMTDKELRLFAVWSARSVPQTDERCINAINVAERYANGEATDEELSAAYSAAHLAAHLAAYPAARSAADSAAYSAAHLAARSAYSAARSAADSAAYSAAHLAARSAADSAAYSAAYSAARSAYSAAHLAAHLAAQINYLKKLFS